MLKIGTKINKIINAFLDLNERKLVFILFIKKVLTITITIPILNEFFKLIIFQTKVINTRHKKII